MKLRKQRNFRSRRMLKLTRFTIPIPKVTETISNGWGEKNPWPASLPGRYWLMELSLCCLERVNNVSLWGIIGFPMVRLPLDICFLNESPSIVSAINSLVYQVWVWSVSFPSGVSGHSFTSAFKKLQYIQLTKIRSHFAGYLFTPVIVWLTVLIDFM